MSRTMIFVVAAVVLNVLIYGGIVAVFFAEERRVDPGRPGARTEHDEKLPSTGDNGSASDGRARAA
ncbi:MAG TPA: hypothetical protein VD764_02990 [Nocardioides sp.]|nr:hypothetical protein [Nocardioides sp.]